MKSEDNNEVAEVTSKKRKYRGIEDLYAVEDMMFSRQKCCSENLISKDSSTVSNTQSTTRAAHSVFSGRMLDESGRGIQQVLNEAKQRLRLSYWMIEELEHAMHLVPDEAEKYYGLGLISVIAGRFEEAFRNLNGAIEMAPDHIAALNLLGELNMKFARYDKAVPVLEQVVSQEPDNMMAITSLCLAYHCLGERGKELAQRSILQFIAPDLIATAFSK